MLLIISVFSSCQKESSKIDTHNKSKDESGDVLVSNRSEHCEACPELISNPDLTVDVSLLGNGSGVNSFGQGAVIGWKATYRSPHHVEINPMGICDFFLTDPSIEETNCLLSGGIYSEGIHYDLNFVNDEHYEYCIAMTYKRFECLDQPSNNLSIKIAIRLANNLPLANSNAPTDENYGNYDFTILGVPIVNNFIENNYNVIINPSIDFPGQNFSAIQMFTFGEEPINSFTRVSFSNVSVRCKTDDLIDINVVDNGGCELTFSPVFDTKTVEEYLSMTWDFGDGTTPLITSDPVVTHQYATSGTYKVTLTVVDVNGCCGEFSKDVMCEDNECDFYLCWSTNWPDPGCTYTNCSNEHSMHWFDDVTGIEVLKNGVYTFHPFNSSIHVNGGYAQIWGQIKEILNQEYSIPYSAFYETDPDNEVTCWKGESMTLFNFFIDDVPTVGQNSIQGIEIRGIGGPGFSTPFDLDFYQKDCK